MKKKVIVACGGAVATSTIAANAIVELAKENNIDIEIAQVRISEIASNLPADLIVTTSKVKRDFGVPLITGMPFVSGLGVDKTKAKILEVLNILNFLPTPNASTRLLTRGCRWWIPAFGALMKIRKLSPILWSCRSS